jgi:UDP-N-acetylglucosamine 4-epimerase
MNSKFYQFTMGSMNQIRGTHRWLVTGAAGFIGMHLVDFLLKSGQQVCGVDNFITGKRKRLEYLKETNSKEHFANFQFVEGDLLDIKVCEQVCKGAQFVLHQAALGSVPRSIHDPLNTHRNNVDAFANILFCAKEAKVKRFVFASSSSVYGDNPILPKREENLGRALSPYAVSKQVDELYADVFQKTYGIETVGLRYFNVFGPAQDPEGPYAAVIPLWIRSLFQGETVYINGDGSNSRDFCYVKNVVKANVQAALSPTEASHQVYNIACGDQTSLNELFEILRNEVAKTHPQFGKATAVHRESRAGDIPHSLASIEKAMRLLDYRPSVLVEEGLRETVLWYSKNTFLFDKGVSA